jgi:hypothetical protein
MKSLVLVRLGVILIASSLIFGCSSSSNSGSEDNPNATATAAPETLEESLHQLGIDTTISDRLDNRGDPYPESYSPLGSVISMREIMVADPNTASTSADLVSEFVVGRAEELLLAGYRSDAASGALINVVDDFSTAPTVSGSNFLVRPESLFRQDTTEAPWVLQRRDASVPNWVVPGARRAATAGDVNGNGFKESVIAYAVDNGSGQDQVRLRVTDALPTSATISDVAIPIDIRYLPIFDLRVSAGDFDGDGVDELALAVARKPIPGVMNTPVGLYVIEGESDGYTIAQEHHLGYTSSLAESYVTLVVESALLDHDAFAEIVLVLNENLANGAPPGLFASQYFVFSDGASQLSVSTSGPIEATNDNADGTQTNHVAVVADVSAGDLDGDAVDELVFGGLENVIDSCQDSPDPITGEQGLRHLLVVRGNHYNNFEQVGALPYRHTPNGCDFSSDFGLRYTHVNTIDFDGDGDIDIQMNEHIYEGPVDNVFASAPIAIIGAQTLITADGSGRYFDRANSAMTVSDQTGDGIDDLITLLVSFNQDPDLHVYSWDEETNRAYRPFAMRLTSDVQDSDLINPIVVPVDVDNDNVSILEYTGEHFLDFTEPVILAVLAAAPCIAGIDQNTTDSCSTSWGSAQTGAAGRSFNVAVNGSVGVGVGAAGAGASFKSLVKLSLTASKEVSESYQLSKSRTFSTGPFEDGVVFTSIAMDRYYYRKIVAKLPDDGFVNERLLVNLPRGANMRLVTREYYNANLVQNPDSPPLMINENVFQHTPGDLSTYPSNDDKDRILAESPTIVNQGRRASPFFGKFAPIHAIEGLEVGPISVGEGSGASELGLEYTEEFGNANALELGIEYEIETLAGAAATASIGLSAERTLQVSHGDSTLYATSVGSIPAEFYADNQYQFGVFAYITAVEGKEFEVVNIWVEQ